MSEKIGEGFLIERELDQQCDSCGEIKELRPYGPPGKTMICFSCAMQDEEGTKKRFLDIIE